MSTHVGPYLVLGRTHDDDEWIEDRDVKIEKITAEFAGIVEQITGTDAADVTCKTSFARDLDIDSSSMIHVLVLAEDKFGMKIPDDRLTRMRTVGDVVRYIADHHP